MADLNRTWTQFAILAEIEDYGVWRIVAKHNELRAAMERLMGGCDGTDAGLGCDCGRCDFTKSAAAQPEERAAVAGDTVRTSIAELVHKCEVHIAAEQAKPLPDNALIDTLCEAVRLAREYVRTQRAFAAQPEEPLCDGSCGEKPYRPHRHGMASAAQPEEGSR